MCATPQHHSILVRLVRYVQKFESGNHGTVLGVTRVHAHQPPSTRCCMCCMCLFAGGGSWQIWKDAEIVKNKSHQSNRPKWRWHMSLRVTLLGKAHVLYWNLHECHLHRVEPGKPHVSQIAGGASLVTEFKRWAQHGSQCSYGYVAWIDQPRFASDASHWWWSADHNFMWLHT